MPCTSKFIFRLKVTQMSHAKVRKSHSYRKFWGLTIFDLTVDNKPVSNSNRLCFRSKIVTRLNLCPVPVHFAFSVAHSLASLFSHEVVFISLAPSINELFALPNRRVKIVAGHICLAWTLFWWQMTDASACTKTEENIYKKIFTSFLKYRKQSNSHV